VRLFALPEVSLRKLGEEKEKTEAVTGVEEQKEEKEEGSSEAVVERWVISVEKPAGLSEAGIGAFESMNGGPVLSYVEPPEELGGAVGWLSEKVWDPVFAPELVKVGKVKMTGGVVAAIKRKNPFCLLNPFVFGMAF
jgi:hypothetical protein